MAVTAKAARGAARKPGGGNADTQYGSRRISTHDGEAQHPWQSYGVASRENQCIIEVDR